MCGWVQGKAEGLFLYARKVLDYKEGGLRSLADVRALPQGMEEWYEGQMERLLEALGQWLKSPEEAYEALRDMVVPLLEVVLSARRPLPLEQLTRLLDSELRDAFGAFSVEKLLRKCLSELTGFLSVIEQTGSGWAGAVACWCVWCARACVCGHSVGWRCLWV